MPSSSSFSRLVGRAFCTVFSVVWLWCGLSVSSYAQTQPDMVWEPTNGQDEVLRNAWITSLFASTGTLFAQMHGGIVVRSTDNGSSWSAVNIGLVNTASFAVESYSLVASGSTLVAGALAYPYTVGPNMVRTIITGTVGNGTNSGLFRSADNGVSWSAINPGLVTINALIANGNNIFAAIGGPSGLGGHVIARSIDNGASWAIVNNSLGNQGNSVSSLAISNGILFAGTRHGILRSMDNGVTWTAANNGLPNNIFGFIGSGVRSFTVNDNTIFVTLWNPGNASGIFRSTNNGASWTAVGGTEFLSRNVAPVIVTNGNIFAGVSGRGIFRSTDNGESWTAINTGLTNLNITSLAASGNTLFAGTAGSGVFRSTIPILPPSLIATPNALNFGTVSSGSGTVQQYTLTGQNLLESVVITAPAGVLLFNAATGTWVNSLTLTPSGGNIFQTIRVRLDSSQVRTITGTILNVSASAAPNASAQASVQVSGVVQRPPAQLTASPQQISLGSILRNRTTAGASFTAEGISLSLPISITAPLGVLLYNPSTRTWGQSLTIPINGADIVNQRVAVRLDSSRVGLVGRIGTLGQQAFISISSGSLSTQVEISGEVLPPPVGLTATPQQISLGGTLLNGITTGATFTVEGTNASQPISITAPLGILLFNPSTRTWGQSLTIAANATDVVTQRVAVRLDSSRVGLVGRIGTVGQQAFISVSSESLSAPVEVSGNVQEPPLLSVQPSAPLDFGTARLGNAPPFTIPLQRSYTITGTNLSETLVITAPDGVQLFDTVSRSWQQTLRFSLAPMPFAANFRTTLQARMDSSRLGNITAPILHRSGSAQVSVGVSGAVISLPELQVSRPSLPAFSDVILGDPALAQQYSVSGTNLVAPVTITAPEGILLFNAATSTWMRTLTLATSATGSVMQTIFVRLDSSQLRSIVNQEIIHQSTGTQATVRVSGAVVPLFLPMGAETTLELRLATPRQTPFLIRDTARVQLWLKESRLLTPRFIARFVKNLRVTLKLDTNNFNIVGFATPASMRAVSPPSPRTSSLTTFTIERIDTSTTREMLLAELLVQAAVGTTTTNTIRTAQPTEWLGNAAANTTRITWGTDSLRLEIRPLFAPRRQNSLAAVVAPNPSSGEVELRYTLSPTIQGAEPLTLVVSDMAGRVVHEQELGKRKTGEAQRETVFLRGLAAASYQVMLVAPSEVLHGRVDIVR